MAGPATEDITHSVIKGLGHLWMIMYNSYHAIPISHPRATTSHVSGSATGTGDEAWSGLEPPSLGLRGRGGGSGWYGEGPDHPPSSVFKALYTPKLLINV